MLLLLLLLLLLVVVVRHQGICLYLPNPGLS
jgi:hypothetical protein